jgi:multicomponent Na+:H+ antiporter subunit F
MTGVAALTLVVLALSLTSLAVCRGTPMDRLVGLEALTVVATCVLLLLSDSFGRSVYVDVALVLALLAFAGSLVFARFLGRSL